MKSKYIGKLFIALKILPPSFPMLLVGLYVCVCFHDAIDAIKTRVQLLNLLMNNFMMMIIRKHNFASITHLLKNNFNKSARYIIQIKKSLSKKINIYIHKTNRFR